MSERLHEVMVASKEMIQPSVFGQVILVTVHVPLLTFTGIEGKMFSPMGSTVIIALLAAFVLSLTFVPAMIAIIVSGKVEEKDNFIIRKRKTHLRANPVRRRCARPPLVIWSSALFFVFTLGSSRGLVRNLFRHLMKKTWRCTPCAFRVRG